MKFKKEGKNTLLCDFDFENIFSFPGSLYDNFLKKENCGATIMIGPETEGISH